MAIPFAHAKSCLGWTLRQRHKCLSPPSKPVDVDSLQNPKSLSQHQRCGYYDRREPLAMLITSTPTIEGRTILHYRGLVTGETIIGANIFRDILASITDVIGGRSKAYEDALMTARENAIQEMKSRALMLQANAIVGVDLDYEVFGEGGMMMVSVSGTAVLLEGYPDPS